MPDLPKFEDWKAPWETAGEEVDADKAKRLIYNALLGQQNAKGKAKESKEALTAAQTENEDLKTQLEAAGDSSLTPLQKAEREIERLKTAATKPAPKDASSDAEIRALKLEIGMEKGLSKADALRLVGTDRDELEEDADTFLAEHKPAGDGSEEGEEGAEGENGGAAKPPQQRPEPTLRTTRSKADDRSGEYVDPATVELVPRR